MIVIVNYGIGNVASVQNMFYRKGIETVVSDDHRTISQAEKIILPGIGAFDAAVIRLRENKLVEVIREFAGSGKPVLGICLGAQLLTKGSEEGNEDGLGILNSRCVKFDQVKAEVKVPHMGWSEVEFKSGHPVFDFVGVDETPRFYFAHSYHFDGLDQNIVSGVSRYGYVFPSVLADRNVIAAQFHPEKSHKFGTRLLENFAHWQYDKN